MVVTEAAAAAATVEVVVEVFRQAVMGALGYSYYISLPPNCITCIYNQHLDRIELRR